jgi:hypothetical protein
MAQAGAGKLIGDLNERILMTMPIACCTSVKAIAEAIVQDGLGTTRQASTNPR